MTPLCSIAGCSAKKPAPDGYKAGLVPGISESAARRIAGKPADSAQFSLPGGLTVDVLTYGFGQVLLQRGHVVCVTIDSDRQYSGPLGIHLGMPEDKVKAAFAGHHKRRRGHRAAYDLVAGGIDTRTRDIYDETDGLMIEMAAANANDPEAPFNAISISLVNGAGLKLLSAITKSKLGGMYPDQHVYNFTDEPWST